VYLLIGGGTALIWVALVYATIRRLRDTTATEREHALWGHLQSAAWSDQFVESLLESNPGSPVVLRQYVANARDRQDWPEALRRAELFVQRAPSLPEARLTYIEALAAAGRRDEAEALLDRLHRRHPFNAEVTLRWARAPAARSDWDEVVRRLATLRRRAPGRLEGYAEGADALVRLGRSAEAEAVLDKGMRKFPESNRMWQSVATFAETFHDPETVAAHWAAYREHFPNEVHGFTRGAAALVKDGRLDEADRLLAAANGFFPGNGDIAQAIAANAERRAHEPG
jgi:predicted Zn-dependent protease